jgi:glycerophosphoryl diester phosphodiesterase
MSHNKLKLCHSKTCKFLVIAHRGASYYAPENTMAAFNRAVEMHTDMIELDVLLTKDGVPVVIHDDELFRLAGIRERVTDLNFDDLLTVDVGSWFGSVYKGERIPSLKQVLGWAKERVALNIEIKAESVTGRKENGIEEKVINLVQEFEMEEYVILSSFDYRAVKRFKQIAPDIKSAVLYEKIQSKGKTPVELVNDYKADFFNVSRRNLNSVRLSSETIRTLPVLVYTVNHGYQMKNLIRKGVFGIFSDRPDLLKEVADAEIPDRCS